MEEDLKLGGNIILSGFKSIDKTQLRILKKMVGNFTMKVSQRMENFQEIQLRMKPVHQAHDNDANWFQVSGKIMANSPYTAEVTEQNLFIAVGSVLNKLEKNIF